ncbi:hypothetical protein ACN28C_23815 [Plantactinospora sp. WMMC1484]|uniref:hypothetical protein n=1 Tax=Plantactinospora sp. WMMC1484 TaxID=3404122 RepID=UPI003BF5B55B
MADTPSPAAARRWPGSTYSSGGGRCSRRSRVDDATDEFTMLYADGRGVQRVYRMTFAEGVWTLWRDAPGFHQRFTGTVGTDGDTVDARWERSEDGVTWHVDFALTYTRIR